MGMEEFLREIEGALGERVVRDPERLKGISRDWWPLAILLEREGLWGRRPPAALLPESSEEVSLIVKRARDHGACLVVQGGGSSVTGASAPRDACAVLSLSRMRRVLELNEEDLYVTVEAGALLFELEELLNRSGYSLRHVPQSFHIASVGGSIASLGSGQYSTGYGNAEDMVLNLEVVLPNGEIAWARRPTVPRSSLGPDLKRLFAGAEGAFGVITKAVLRVVPLPPYSVSSSFQVPSFSQGLKLVRELMKRGLRPAIARLHDEAESRLRFGSERPLLLLSYEGYDDDLVALLWEKADQIIREGGGSEVGEEPFKKWLKSRFNYLEEMEVVYSMGMWFETFDLSATWSVAPRLHERLTRELEDMEVIAMAHASHFYLNGAALYFTVLFERSPEAYWKVARRVFEAAIEEGASVSHHHGAGELKGPYLEAELGPMVKALRKIKRALDEGGVLRSALA
ncbi:MAG: FAD-binding oxidoreductase [Acidilobaceae archaeon]|nr:FAD-binding oxidoreductase [Acidilobaceae archaeon]MCX8166021.1 FAD-binding oxidoreductase [Acidilobaceae archaeon]MDW7974662.1 FAD-binding oxidoreductase [Sulfolobales archaeon]